MNVWTVRIPDGAPWDALWTTRDERTLRLGDMSREHRENLLAWLERNAKRLKFGYEMWFVLGPQPSGDGACDAFESAAHQLMETDPIEWVRELPLYRALRALTPAGPGTSPRRWQNRRAALRAGSPQAFLDWCEEQAVSA